MKSDDDRRREARRPLVFKVSLPGIEAVCETQDISTGGAFLRSETAPVVGEEVVAEVSFPGFLAPCTRRGIIRWVRTVAVSDDLNPAGFGIQWLEAPVNDPLRRALGQVRDVSVPERRARILVGEDNEHIREMIARALPKRLGADANIEVTTVGDGAAAWEQAQQGGLHLVILDIYMPGLTGLEVLGRIRATPELATTPVIIISAAGGSARKESYEAGADFFMDKPLRLMEILDTVRTLLRLPGGD